MFHHVSLQSIVRYLFRRLYSFLWLGSWLYSWLRRKHLLSTSRPWVSLAEKWWPPLSIVKHGYGGRRCGHGQVVGVVHFKSWIPNFWCIPPWRQMVSRCVVLLRSDGESSPVLLVLDDDFPRLAILDDDSRPIHENSTMTCKKRNMQVWPKSQDCKRLHFDSEHWCLGSEYWSCSIRLLSVFPC